MRLLKKYFLPFGLVIVIHLCFTKCEKPNESLIEGSWYVEAYQVNGFDSTNVNSIKAYINRPTQFRLLTNPTVREVIFPNGVSAQGYWKLVNNNKEIYFTTSGGVQQFILLTGFRKIFLLMLILKIGQF